jgi:hypothetical protein
MREPQTGINGMDGMELDEFEQQLTQALCRVNAPEGFAARVLERATLPAKVAVMRPRLAALRGRAWVGGAIAAMLALAVFVGDQAYVRHERERAALANQQFAMAMRVTDHALDQTRAQLERAGLKLGK